MDVPSLRAEVLRHVTEAVSKMPESMKNHKNGKVSVLMKKEYDHLKLFNVEEVVTEFGMKFPNIYNIMLAMMLPQDMRCDPTAKASGHDVWHHDASKKS